MAAGTHREHPHPRRRSLLSRLVGNTAIVFAGNSVQRALTFVTTLVLARGLGGDRFGLYSYVVSYMFLFAFFADLGVERVVTREVSRRPQQAGDLLGSAIVVKLGLSALAMLGAIVTALVIGMEREAFLCVVVASIGLPMTIELVFRGFFQSRYQMAYTYAAMLPSTLWVLLVALAVTHFQWPLYFLFALGLVSVPFVVGGFWWAVRHRLHLTLRPRRRLMRELLHDSMQLGGFVFLFLLSMRLDQLLLFHLRGEGEVALYAVGVRLAEALAMLPEVVLVTVFPLLVASEYEAPERFRETYRLGFKYLAAVGIPIALALTLARDEIIALLYGPQYADAAMPMAVLAWNMCFGFLGVIYLSLFVAQSRHRALLLVSGVAVLVNLGLNLLWIPAYGATGAAIATLVANAAGFIAWLVLPPTRLYMVTCIAESWRALLAATIAAAIVWTFELPGLVGMAAVAIGYPPLLWLLGGFSWSDVGLVRRIFAEEEPPVRAGGAV